MTESRSDSLSPDGKQTIVIVVDGPPPGKPRMTRRDKWMQRDCVVRYRKWCDKVRKIAGQLPPACKVLALNWTAHFEPPKSWSNKKRMAAIGTLHRPKPDRDNIDKACLDCLYPGSDSAIARGLIEKLWAERSRIKIVIELEP